MKKQKEEEQTKQDQPVVIKDLDRTEIKICWII